MDAIARRTGQARESIQPVTSRDTVVTFHPVHTRDTWLSSLTFGSDCSRVSLYSFGTRSSSDARGSLESREPRDPVQAWVSLVAFPS